MNIKKSKKAFVPSEQIDPNKEAEQAADFEEISWEDLAKLAWGGSRTRRDSPKMLA
jgi:hypothetical protein